MTPRLPLGLLALAFLVGALAGSCGSPVTAPRCELLGVDTLWFVSVDGKDSLLVELTRRWGDCPEMREYQLLLGAHAAGAQ